MIGGMIMENYGDMSIDNLSLSDIPFVSEIGTNNYSSNYYEGEESFSSKIILNINSCFGYKYENKLVGYLISFPYILGQSFPIRSFYKRPINPDCIYLHDLCVDYNYRKLSIGTKLVQKFLEQFPPPFALTSVNNSHKFWNKFGFEIVNSIEYCHKPAFYMVRK
jgi:GNAT superfamily N-acetyltransferase